MTWPCCGGNPIAPAGVLPNSIDGNAMDDIKPSVTRNRKPAGSLCAAEGLEVNYLSPEEIHAWPPYTSLPEPAQRREALRGRLLDIGCWTPEQIAGKRWNIGCVALEITQRCNLDCTLCYLSDTSEAVKDVPLQEVFRRIEMIYQHYGQNTDVQVTGCDPTLRNRAELICGCLTPSANLNSTNTSTSGSAACWWPPTARN